MVTFDCENFYQIIIAMYFLVIAVNFLILPLRVFEISSPFVPPVTQLLWIIFIKKFSVSATALFSDISVSCSEQKLEISEICNHQALRKIFKNTFKVEIHGP